MVLVVCPATLKSNWQIEARKWLKGNGREWKIAVGSTQSLPLPEHGFNFVIVNYEVVSKHWKGLSEIEWDLLAVDEVHKCKSPKAIRTCAIMGGVKGKTKYPGINARFKIGMTGTPIVNRPSELFGIVSWLDPDWKPKYWYFMKRYCNMQRTRFGLDNNGANLDRLPELQKKLRETILIRRLKADVLTELPPKMRQVIELPVTKELQTYLDNETRVRVQNQELREELQARKELAKVSGDQDSFRDAVKALKDAVMVDFSEMARVRHDTAVAKIPYVVEHIKGIIDDGKKVGVYAHHHDVINGIAKAFPLESVSLTGETKQEDRQLAVDRFQSDPNCKIFIGSIQAAGVGITLTAASHAVFAELDWVPGNVTQAEDRHHRIGQRDSVLVQHLVLEGSLDAHMARMIVEKQSVADAALDKEYAEEEVAPVERHVTTTRKEIDKESKEMSRETIEKIHLGLKMLAGMCDGARRLDGAGFSRIDTRIGHSLAEFPILSPAQAVLGKKLINKYKRQIPQIAEDVCGGS